METILRQKGRGTEDTQRWTGEGEVLQAAGFSPCYLDGIPQEECEQIRQKGGRRQDIESAALPESPGSTTHLINYKPILWFHM